MFLGGSKNGESMVVTNPMPRLLVPLPLVRTVDHRAVFDVDAYLMSYRTEEYRLARRMVGPDGPVETLYVEAKLYEAELRAQESGEHRDRMVREALLHFGVEPDPRALVTQPYLMAWVWRCDSDCNCTEAQVIGWTGAYTIDGDSAEWPSRNGELTIPYAYVDGRRAGAWVELWRGRFHPEGEPGAADELVVLSEYLKAIGAEDVAQRISWPWQR